MSSFKSLTRGRLVSPARASAQAVGAAPDGALARMAKFIPAEIVAVYLGFVNGVQALFANGAAPVVWGKEFWTSAILILACWVAAPCYYLNLEGDPKTKRVHAWMAALAFPAWAYASGGPFVAFKVHEPVFALGGLALATLVGVFVKVE